MIRFRGQGDKRRDKSAEEEEGGMDGGREGGRRGAAAAALCVYMHRCLVDRVCLLMSLAGAAERAHTHMRRNARIHTHTHTSMHKYKIAQKWSEAERWHVGNRKPRL